jgi:hypothetical protein
MLDCTGGRVLFFGLAIDQPAEHSEDENDKARQVANGVEVMRKTARHLCVISYSISNEQEDGGMAAANTEAKPSASCET